MIEEYEKLFLEANTNLIKEFDLRIENFKNSRNMLGEIESKIGVPASIRFNVGSLAMDIINFSRIFLNQYKNEIKRDASDSHNLNLKFSIISSHAKTKELSKELPEIDNIFQFSTPIITTLYKAYFFFLRSYQDAIYKFLLHLEGASAGASGGIRAGSTHCTTFNLL